MASKKKEESIYNLIEIKTKPPKKAPMYHSKYPAAMPPTASTFGATTTTTVGQTNMNGQMEWDPVRQHVRGSATFGPPRNGGRKPKPDMFLISKTSSKPLPEAAKFTYTTEKERKPALPKRDEAPVMGLTTSKNFVISNAIENILSDTKNPKSTLAKGMEVQDGADAQGTFKHAEFGKIPGYLSKVKQQINAEYAAIAEFKQAKESQKKTQCGDIQLLPEAERMDLLNAMKDKWEKINHEYQQMTHLVHLDTISKVKRKEHFEKSLFRLEKDIEKLSKKHVFIRRD